MGRPMIDHSKIRTPQDARTEALELIAVSGVLHAQLRAIAIKLTYASSS